VGGAYFVPPGATAAAFRDGWFRTGDLGLIDTDGFVYITGRRSDMYISGGANIHPREIEEKLLRHPELKEAAVLGVPDPTWGEIGVAICVRETDATLEEQDLLLWLREHLAAYKVPKRAIFWETLPRSGYGKVTKKLLRHELEARGQLGDTGALR
jgi:fatty-acyl-CoA synthase